MASIVLRSLKSEVGAIFNRIPDLSRERNAASANNAIRRAVGNRPKTGALPPDWPRSAAAFQIGPLPEEAVSSANPKILARSMPIGWLV